MALPWSPESGLHPSIARINEAPRGKTVDDLNTEGISVGVDDLLSTHRHAHKTLTATGALALVLAALALTYLLVNCMRHLSKGLTLSGQQSRVLASNYPYDSEDACRAPAGDAEQETEPAYTEGPEPEGAGVAPLPEDLGAHGPAPAALAGETRRVLSGPIQSRVGRTLLLMEQPAALLTPLIPLLRADHCLALVRNLCRVAALELSAFATIPPCLQPLRARVAQVYSDLIERVLTTEPTAGEAVRRGWKRQLFSLHLLLERLAHVPAETESLSPANYRMTMENQQRACHWVYSQILNVLQTIKQIKTQDPTPDSNEAVYHQRQILVSLFVARRHQILRCVTLRYWLAYHHPQFEEHLVYNGEILKQARKAPFDLLGDKLNAIYAAVIDAGGTPTTQFAPLPPLPEEQQQHQQQQHLLQRPRHDPHPVPPHTHLPHAHVPAHIYFASPRAGHPHPLAQALPQAQYMPRPPHPAPLGGKAQAQGAPMHFAPPGERQPHPSAQPHSPTQNMPHLPQAAAQPPEPFDSAQQDSQFPAVNPNPQVPDQPQPSPPFLQIQLPAIYYYPFTFVFPLDEPSTSSRVRATFAGLGPSPSHSQPSGSAGQPQTPQASSQQTPTDTNQNSS
ncbi:hypothetical protein ACSSS7_007802 [Eimeria intestinalis]